MRRGAWLVAGVVAMSAIPLGVRTQGTGYPMTLIAPGQAGLDSGGDAGAQREGQAGPGERDQPAKNRSEHRQRQGDQNMVLEARHEHQGQ